MRVLAAALFACWVICSEATLSAQSLSEIVSTHSQAIAKSSRKTIQPAIDALVASKLPNVEFMLVQWRAKALWLNKSTNAIIAVQDKRMIDLDTQSDLGPFEKAGFKQIKPNSGVRNLISGALVAFQLNAPDIAMRKAALASIRRNEDPAYLLLLEQSLELETDPALVAEKQQLVHLLTLKYGQSVEARLTAIAAIGGSLDVEVRGALNPLLATRRTYATALPDDANIAKVLVPDRNGFSTQTAYQLLVAGGEAAAQPSLEQIKQALIDNIDGGRIGGVPIAQLDDPAARMKAYGALAQAGLVPAQISQSAIDATVSNFSFFDQYLEPDPQITAAAQTALKAISYRVSLSNMIDILLDAISLASIYFLAAIGLAITFGVMGVINMAHGEFVAIGGYVTFLVQNFFIQTWGLSSSAFGWYFIVALPVSFIVAAVIGLIMEVSIIRFLYRRPLESLLCTWGISMVMQQGFRLIFGAANVQVNNPTWLMGNLSFAGFQMSYTRLLIILIALVVVALTWLLLR